MESVAGFVVGDGAKSSTEGVVPWLAALLKLGPGRSGLFKTLVDGLFLPLGGGGG